MLQALDSYLWSTRATNSGPQFAALKDMELAKKPTKLPFIETIGDSLNVMGNDEDKEKRVLAFDYSTPLPRFFEHRGHWGVQASIYTGNCRSCMLPLTENLGLNVFVFPCGHAYHQSCIPEQACRICFAENNKKKARRRESSKSAQLSAVI